jgi:hypothetical protein
MVNLAAPAVDNYLIDIARGATSSALGTAPVLVTGFNGDVDNVREDLWDNGGTYVFPANTGIRMRIVSSSISDAGDPVGTGALTVDIHYLDAAGESQEEQLTLNGTTEVLTVATNIRRIIDFHVKTVGTNRTAVGNISLTNTAGNVTYAVIPAGNNRARQAVYTVPLGKKLFVNALWGGSGAVSGAHYCEIMLRATCDVIESELLPGVFNHKTGLVVLNGASSVYFPIPITFPALADVKLTALSDASNASVVVSGGFSGWLENE